MAVNIIIHSGDCERDCEPVFVTIGDGVNKRVFHLPRDLWVTVPESVYDVLRSQENKFSFSSEKQPN